MVLFRVLCLHGSMHRGPLTEMESTPAVGGGLMGYVQYEKKTAKEQVVYNYIINYSNSFLDWSVFCMG